MIGRKRVLGLTMLALAVPAFAFGGEEAPSGPASLTVNASLGGCGLVNAAIVCQIDASWNALEGADYYTVSVTRADGSVVDAGQASGTSRSLFVPYVGPGRYSVEVAAWGTPPGEDEPEVLAREQAFSAEGGETRTVKGSPGDAAPGGEGRESTVEADGGDPAQEPVTGEPALPETPQCEPLADDLGEPDPESAPAADAPAAATAEGAGAGEAEAAAATAPEDELPVCP